MALGDVILVQQHGTMYMIMMLLPELPLMGTECTMAIT
jgi:hypothetical protein